MNWDEETLLEEKAKFENDMSMTDNEFTDHQEVMDTFLNWERSF
ncbi:hypothetical protein ACFSJW_10605 [Flavobacterium artemisiae]|uniref:Uncharacterized protein n=1 Tax=Flavobacterium artemisiae TaxID=2126556 RepID=A0ABW4HEY5_9FLAO